MEYYGAGGGVVLILQSICEFACIHLHVQQLVAVGTKLPCCAVFMCRTSCFDSGRVRYIPLNPLPHVNPKTFKKMHSFSHFPISFQKMRIHTGRF